jgi:BirA family biotin operon repressor/biotin-[acetyl-CoA-carboxylase] ligase
MPLTADTVEPLLRGAFGRPYRFVPECASTQDELRGSGLPEGAVVATDHQTAGRGRSGSAWTDTAGEALLFSLLLRPPPTPQLPQLSLAAALAVAEAIEETAGVHTQVKWPNDVLVDGRKVAGLLLEGGPAEVVLGVGVNVNQREATLPPTSGLLPLSLRAATGRDHDRARLLAEMLRRLETRYRAWLAGEIEELIGALELRNFLRDRPLVVAGERCVGGRIAPDGRLEVVLPDGSTRRVESGEVQLA